MDADLVLSGGPIYTMDARQPVCRALAIGNGRILARGSDEVMTQWRGPRTRAIDLAGKAVVPGFVDAHIHFASYATARRQVNLDLAATLARGLDLLRAAANELPDGTWLRGRGWDRNRWGRLPTAADLDAVTGDRPAALSSHDGHALWLNSSALRAVGIDRLTTAPSGGVIERDARGEPTGVLFESAEDLAWRRIPDPTDAELRDAVRAALASASAAGLTGIHNLEDARTRQTFAALEAAGELTLRVYHGISRGELASARDHRLRTGDGSPWLRVGPVKLFSDGALGSRTAYLLEPYEGRQADGYRGVPTLEPEELQHAMMQAAEAELDLAVHAIGDAAVRSVLDAYLHASTQTPALAQRMLRIEHAQLIHPTDRQRMADMGVIASMQPIHAVADWRTADTHWGSRSRYGYAWRDVLRAGVRLAFGTDAPVERLEPLRSVHAAVTRVDPDGLPEAGWYPEQRLTLAEAIHAYTVGSAVAERSADRRGALAEGMDADLVVLEPDPFQLEPSALLDTQVTLTVVGGRITFERGGA
jgi:predicted amidohydrolase YtcJ